VSGPGEYFREAEAERVQADSQVALNAFSCNRHGRAVSPGTGALIRADALSAPAGLATGTAAASPEAAAGGHGLAAHALPGTGKYSPMTSVRDLRTEAAWTPPTVRSIHTLVLRLARENTSWGWRIRSPGPPIGLLTCVDEVIGTRTVGQPVRAAQPAHQHG
jgi:hypothetical protein